MAKYVLLDGIKYYKQHCSKRNCGVLWVGGGGEGRINTKIIETIYNIRDTLALRYSKSVDCWLGECGLYNYRM